MYGHQQARPPVARAPREAWERPARVEPLPGTSYGLLVYGSPRVVSGPAVGSLVAGIAGLVVALVVGCFGLVAASDSVGAWVAGAFAVLAVFLGGAGLGLGLVGLRRIRRNRQVRHGTPAAVAVGPQAGPGGEVGGRGIAIAGLVCGATAMGIALFALLGAVLLAIL